MKCVLKTEAPPVTNYTQQTDPAKRRLLFHISENLVSVAHVPSNVSFLHHTPYTFYQLISSRKKIMKLEVSLCSLARISDVSNNNNCNILINLVAATYYEASFPHQSNVCRIIHRQIYQKPTRSKVTQSWQMMFFRMPTRTREADKHLNLRWCNDKYSQSRVHSRVICL